MATQILAIPIKRTDRRIVGYLTRSEMGAIIAAPLLSSWIGRRDHALLLTLYNTRARVSEIAYIRRSQFQFGDSNFLQLNGKGRKERTVPLWSKTALFLQGWFKEIQKIGGDLAFPNARGTALTRHGVTYILDQAFKKATRSCGSLKSKTVSPHVI
jgi:integrase/recombinase XerD